MKLTRKLTINYRMIKTKPFSPSFPLLFLFYFCHSNSRGFGLWSISGRPTKSVHKKERIKTLLLEIFMKNLLEKMPHK